MSPVVHQVVKHIEPRLVEAAIQGSVEPFLATCQFPAFRFTQHVAYMAWLAERCRPGGILGHLGCHGLW